MKKSVKDLRDSDTILEHRVLFSMLKEWLNG